MRFRRLFHFSSFPSFRVLFCFVVCLRFFFFSLNSVAAFHNERNISSILEMSEKPSDTNGKLSILILWAFYCFEVFFSLQKEIRKID